jgi:hypothetical protein
MVYNWTHNGLDVKRSVGLKMSNNACHEEIGGHGGACFYFENAAPVGSFWVTSTPEVVGNEIVDSNGNLQKVTTAGTTQSPNHPTWATTLNGTTSDNTVVWTLVALGVQPAGSTTSITWSGNTVYDSGNAFQIESGQSEGQNSNEYNTVAHIYNNTADIGSNNWAITQATNAGVSLDIRNNIFDTNTALVVCGTTHNTNSCGTVTAWDYNDNGGSAAGGSAVSTFPGMSGMGAHDLLNANPLYGASAAHALYLNSGSPCINAGLSGLTSNPNMGAF